MARMLTGKKGWPLIFRCSPGCYSPQAMPNMAPSNETAWTLANLLPGIAVWHANWFTKRQMVEIPYSVCDNSLPWTCIIFLSLSFQAISHQLTDQVQGFKDFSTSPQFLWKVCSNCLWETIFLLFEQACVTRRNRFQMISQRQRRKLF